MNFVSTAGQGKAILTVSRGTNHFDFNFQKCFVIPPKSKMTARLDSLQLHGARTYHVRVESSSRCFPRGLVNFIHPRKLV